MAAATSQWSYDTGFRVASHSINGVAATYAYDADSLLTQAGVAALARASATGLLASVTVGSVTTVLTLSPYGELATLAATFNSTALYSEGLSYEVHALTALTLIVLNPLGQQFDGPHSVVDFRLHRSTVLTFLAVSEDSAPCTQTV